MKKVTNFGSDVLMGKREINGNHYIVVVYPFGEGSKPRQKRQRRVHVFGSEEDGGYPNFPYQLRKEYDKLVSDRQMSHNKESLERHVSKVVNDAVCELEGRVEEREEMLGRVEAALEANAEVHGGIDYELEQEREGKNV